MVDEFSGTADGFDPTAEIGQNGLFFCRQGRSAAVGSKVEVEIDASKPMPRRGEALASPCGRG